MQNLFYKGKKVIGECDNDLSFMFHLLHVIDDSLGSEHIVRKIPALCCAWDSLVSAFDDAYSSSFSDYGSAGDILTIILRE